MYLGNLIFLLGTEHFTVRPLKISEPSQTSNCHFNLLQGKTVPRSSSAALVVFPIDKHATVSPVLSISKGINKEQTILGLNHNQSSEVLKSNTLSHGKYTPVLYD